MQGEAALLALAGARQLPGGGVGWLRELRDRSAERFRARGLPTQRVEAWKYTSLNPLRGEAWQAPPTETAMRLARDTTLQAEVRIVLVNGKLRPELSRLPKADGLRVDSLADLLERDPEALRALLGDAGEDLPLIDLNTALMADGCVLRLAPGTKVEPLIEIVSLAEPGGGPLTFQPRHVILVEPDAAATVVERHVGAPGTYFANGATQIVLRQGAALRHYRLVEEGAGTVHVHTHLISLAEDARFEGFSLVLGGRLTRNETHVALTGRRASVALNGAYGLTGREHCDHTTVVTHIAGDTSSRQIYKGVLSDRARGVFQGKIAVRPDAQRIDGHQLSKAMLLSDGAEIDTKPELEILADDVKCSHGATAGELDRDALFYLRARGVPEDEARRMLIHAFLADVVEEVSEPAVRAALAARIEAWLAEVAR